jgi:hypothetical protein
MLILHSLFLRSLFPARFTYLGKTKIQSNNADPANRYNAVFETKIPLNNLSSFKKIPTDLANISSFFGGLFQVGDRLSLPHKNLAFGLSERHLVSRCETDFLFQICGGWYPRAAASLQRVGISGYKLCQTDRYRNKIQNIITRLNMVLYQDL